MKQIGWYFLKYVAIFSVVLVGFSLNTPAFGFEQTDEGETSHSFSESLKSANLTLDQFNLIGNQAEIVTARFKELTSVPVFGGVWFEGNQLFISSTDPSNKVLNSFAKQVDAKVVKTEYRYSDVQHVFSEGKAKFPDYNAASYRYDNPDTMTIRVAMKAEQTADIDELGELPPNIKVENMPMEQLSQLTAGVSSNLVESVNTFYTMQPDDLELTCSFAFPAIAPDGSNARVSAGHCKEGTKTNNITVKKGANTLEAGTYGIVNFAPDSKVSADVSAIKLKDQSLPNPPTIDSHGTEPDIQITGTTDPIPGAPICKSGSYTGVTCGKIIDIRSQDMNEGTYIDGFATNLDSYPGDSGDGAFIGTKAVGIQSGSIVDKNTRKLLSTNFTTLSTAMKALPGYYIKTTNEATHPVIAPLRDGWLKNGGKAITGDTKSNQHKIGNTTIQNFTNGDLVNSKTGTFFIENSIKTQWDKNGGITGTYGVPTNFSITQDGVTKQNFQHGTIEVLNNKEEYWKSLVQKYLPLAIGTIALIIIAISTYRISKPRT
ncbi:MAG: S1 family peptidase [Micrococcaceae bacterium]